MAIPRCGQTIKAVPGVWKGIAFFTLAEMQEQTIFGMGMLSRDQ
jgi:hypothetical protein